MGFVNIKELFRNENEYIGKEVVIGGWVRSNRDSKAFGFLVINDSTFFEPLQVVYADKLDNFADVARLFGLPSRTYVFGFWNGGYKTFNLTHKNIFIPKHSKKLEIPEEYRKYILNLIKDNTVLNNQNKSWLSV